MATTISSLAFSTFMGSQVVINEPNSQPMSVKCRPLRVSAACASTAERTIPQRIAMPAASSLYEVLGIQMGASCQEIKAAYRKLARVLHPDVAATSQRESTAHAFMKVHEAYETLSDPEKRADYDLTLFRRRRLVSSPFATSEVAAAPMATSSNSRFSGYTRTWETDQCW